MPLVFVALATLLLANTAHDEPRESVFGVALIAAGAIVYAARPRRR